MNMKINLLNGRRLNFGSIPLYKAKIEHRLHDGSSFTPADVFITRLEKFDLGRLNEELLEWQSTTYGYGIIKTFENYNPEAEIKDNIAKYFYAVEVPGMYGKKQIRALAIVSNDILKNNAELDYIQTNNLQCMPFNIKGAGNCLLYMALKAAQILGTNSFNIRSNKDAVYYYLHNGLNRVRKFKFHVKKAEYEQKIKEFEDKYEIKCINPARTM